jgi:hypothetical protein
MYLDINVTLAKMVVVFTGHIYLVKNNIIFKNKVYMERKKLERSGLINK